jgi:hypothetical protein
MISLLRPFLHRGDREIVRATCDVRTNWAVKVWNPKHSAAASDHLEP